MKVKLTVLATGRHKKQAFLSHIKKLFQKTKKPIKRPTSTHAPVKHEMNLAPKKKSATQEHRYMRNHPSYAGNRR